MRRRAFARLVLALSFLTHGCLLDIAPAREVLDTTWQARMLAGEYGTWNYGEKGSYIGPDRIESSPLGASGTRYGIRINDQSPLGGGGWSLAGGIVGRVERPGVSIEFFGKQVARVHGLKQTVGPEDYSYEFFLVVRPTGMQRGRLVQRWRFPREALADRPPSDVSPGFPKVVNGYLSFDERSTTATITITGLVRPFEERVDLSDELR